VANFTCIHTCIHTFIDDENQFGSLKVCARNVTLFAIVTHMLFLAHSAVQAVDPAVKRHSDGVTVLGLFIQRELSAIVNKAELGLQELMKLAWYHREDSIQCELLLLRYCDVPRFSHVLRALPPNIVATAASAHHDAIKNCLSDLLGPDDPLFCWD
jgi:hypothetical protein